MCTLPPRSAPAVPSGPHPAEERAGRHGPGRPAGAPGERWRRHLPGGAADPVPATPRDRPGPDPLPRKRWKPGERGTKTGVPQARPRRRPCQMGLGECTRSGGGRRARSSSARAPRGSHPVNRVPVEGGERARPGFFFSPRSKRAVSAEQRARRSGPRAPAARRGAQAGGCAPLLQGEARPRRPPLSGAPSGRGPGVKTSRSTPQTARRDGGEGGTPSPPVVGGQGLVADDEAGEVAIEEAGPPPADEAPDALETGSARWCVRSTM